MSLHSKRMNPAINKIEHICSYSLFNKTECLVASYCSVSCNQQSKLYVRKKKNIMPCGFLL